MKYQVLGTVVMVKRQQGAGNVIALSVSETETGRPGLDVAHIPVFSHAEEFASKYGAYRRVRLTIETDWSDSAEGDAFGNGPDVQEITDRLIEAMGCDAGTNYAATVAQRRRLLSGVRRMVQAGCAWSEKDVDAFATEDIDVRRARFERFDGFEEANAALEAIFGEDEDAERPEQWSGDQCATLRGAFGILRSELQKAALWSRGASHLGPPPLLAEATRSVRDGIAAILAPAGFGHRPLPEVAK